MTITQELIDRVERALQADRRLDVEIGIATGYKAHMSVGDGVETPLYSTPSCLPRYTESIDAAMVLAGDHFGSLMKGRFVGGRVAYVAVVTAPTRAEGQASTPALAITAASLRARMVQS